MGIFTETGAAPQLLRRRRLPQSSMGWLFFVLAFVVIIAGSSKAVLGRFDYAPAKKKAVRFVVLILAFALLAASVIADQIAKNRS